MRRFKITRKMMTFGIASVGTIGVVAIAVPMLTSCSGVKTLTLSKDTFDLQSTAGDWNRAYVTKGWNDKWYYVQLCNANKQITTVGDWMTIAGGTDTTPGTASILAGSEDSDVGAQLYFSFSQNHHKTTSGRYTLYGFAMNFEQMLKWRIIADSENPNYSAKAKIPGDLIKCTINVSNGDTWSGIHGINTLNFNGNNSASVTGTCDNGYDVYGYYSGSGFTCSLSCNNNGQVTLSGSASSSFGSQNVTMNYTYNKNNYYANDTFTFYIQYN